MDGILKTHKFANGDWIYDSMAAWYVKFEIIGASVQLKGRNDGTEKSFTRPRFGMSWTATD